MFPAFARATGFRRADTTPQSFVLSEAGAAWLRRTFADGDPFAAQHQLRTRHMMIDAQGFEHLVTANEAESPMARLKARNLIDARAIRRRPKSCGATSRWRSSRRVSASI